MKSMILLAFSATAYAVAFDGPAPTPVDPNALLKGFSAKPTAKPRAAAVPAMFRRQASDDAVCGYLQGDAELPVSCTVGDCYHATSLNWFGCCTGSVAADCSIATSCVPSASVNSCLEDSTCSGDEYAMACTEASAPYCGHLYSTQQDGGVVSHLVCVPTETSVEVLPTIVAGGGVKSSILANTRTQTGSSPVPTGGDDDDETTTARVTGARTSVGGNIGSGNAPATTRSTAGAAIQTAKAMAGAAAAGFFALLV